MPAKTSKISRRAAKRRVCAYAGCSITPRAHPRYCYLHRHQADVDAAKRAGELAAREAALTERQALAEREGRDWAAKTGSDQSRPDARRQPDAAHVMPDTAAALSDIEAEARIAASPETATWAWHQASAMSTHLAGTRAKIAERVGAGFGEGDYTSRDGRTWSISEKPSQRWDGDRLLADIDEKIGISETDSADGPLDAAGYVAALREAASFTSYSPWRLRSILPGGDMTDAYEQVTFGPSGLRPLDADRDDTILGDEHVRADWDEAWQAAKDRCSSIAAVPSPENGPDELIEMLAAVDDAQALTRDTVKKWEARAAYDRRPGEVLRDMVGTPVAKVVADVEVRGPRHDVVDAALARIGDRAKIREAVQTVTSGQPKPKKRGIAKLGLVESGYVDTENRWRANQRQPAG